MAENSRFDFCPKCGALARDGVCTSCGYQNPDITVNKQQTEGEEQSMQELQPDKETMSQQEIPVTGQAQMLQGVLVTGQAQMSQGVPVTGQMQMPQGAPGMGQMQMPQGIPVTGQIQYRQGQPYPGSYQPYMQAVSVAKPGEKKKSKTTLVVCLILGFVLLALVALILAGIYSIQKRDRNQNIVSDGRWQGAALPEEENETTDENEEGTSASSPSFSHFSTDVTQEKRDGEGQDEAYSYYTGPYNALRDDLSYDLKFTRETYSSKNSSNVFLQVDYPQITTTDYPYREYINAALYYEYKYYMNFFKEQFKPLMRSDDDIFSCEIESYVTYMDEKTLSVVFKESIYLELENDPFRVFSFYCLNFDLENGNLIKNEEVLHVDDDFVKDFRQREIFENGDEALTDYSDQEIREMLESDETLVLFYTPMGLEVGLNLSGRIVYVTYEDYEQFLNSY